MAKRHFTLVAAVLLVLGLMLGGTSVVLGTPGTQGAQHAQHGKEAAIHTPEQLKWQDGPPSLPAGSQWVVLEGDPAKKGEYFAFRLRLPDGYRIPPHWHPVPERVTVISGTFHLGHGETFDEKTSRALGPGSYFTMPPEMRHFARAEGETIVQLNSLGPWDIRYVNPEDDPRKPATKR